MITSTNIAFTLLIKIDSRLKEFNFRKRSDVLYDANTNDEYSNRYYFRMEKENSSWKINGQGLPDWILKNEIVVVEALEKEAN